MDGRIISLFALIAAFLIFSALFESPVQTLYGGIDADHHKNMLLFLNVDLNEDLNYLNEDIRDSASGETGGAGSGSSGEAFDNILISETQREYVNAGSAVSYRFLMDGITIRYVNFTGITSSGLIPARVEVLKGTSTLVDSPPPDVIYRHLNIWAGNLGWANPDNIAYPAVDFMVEKSWVVNNNIDVASIRLNRFSDGKWSGQQTLKTGEDADYLYFKSMIVGFSPFAITGKAAPGVSEPITGVQEIPVTDTPDFRLLVALVMISAVFLILRRKKS